MAVKEPYYRHNGSDNDYMICVDHPSDVIFLRFTDPIIQRDVAPRAAAEDRGGMENGGRSGVHREISSDRNILVKERPSTRACSWDRGPRGCYDECLRHGAVSYSGSNRRVGRQSFPGEHLWEARRCQSRPADATMLCSQTPWPPAPALPPTGGLSSSRVEPRTACATTGPAGRIFEKAVRDQPRAHLVSRRSTTAALPA